MTDETKHCKRPECGRPFTRYAGQSSQSWREKKYCCTDCARRDSYRHPVLPRERAVKPAGLMPGVAPDSFA